MSAGGIPKFKPDEFERLVDGYLDERRENAEIPTIMHFAMTIGISREQLYKYYKVNDDYKDAYSKLETYRDGITEFTALNPKEGDIRNAGIMVFALKNIGWTDKQEITQKTTHDVSQSLANRLAGGSLE